MSIGLIIEKQVLYDNPSAPIVKFSSEENFDEDEEDMLMDDPISTQSTLEHAFQAFSLEDLVQSFDHTIHSGFSNQEIIDTSQTHLNTQSNKWSDLIENLRTSLRQDLKLPHLEKISQKHDENDFPSIDDEEDSPEPFLTAEQVISEIDFILEDMTPDSGYYDLPTSSMERHLKTQSIDSLNLFLDELNQSIKALSNILVDELANRDDLEDEKETKDRFIELLFSIEKRIDNNCKSGMYLTTIIPFDRQYSKYLSIEYLQILNRILHAINEDNCQVPELLTNYILKVLCT